jgi:hypothetical protein
MAEDERQERRGGPALGSGPGSVSQEPYLKTDPTTLTTEALRREIHLLRELVEAKFDSIKEIEGEKFSSINKRFELVEQQRLEQKADTKAAVDAALTAQKEAVKEQTTASELAISKSENATAKQLEQLGATFQTTIGGVTTIIGDLKERVLRTESITTTVEGVTSVIADMKDRLGRLETIKVAGKEAKDNSFNVIAAAVGLGVLLIGGITLLIALLA